MDLVTKLSPRVSIASKALRASTALSASLNIGLISAALTSAALLGIAALSPAQAQVSDKQLTNAFQQIARGDTDFKLDRTSRIVLDINDAALIETLTAPRGWVQNLRYATGLQLDVVVGTPGKNDIFLTRQSLADLAETLTLTALGTSGTVSKDIGNNLLTEGYQFQSGENGLTIKYNANLGALRGMQTISQLLLADGKPVGQHDTIVGGTGLDFPAFESRQVMLDVGRLFMPVDQLIGYMEKMSLNKLNELHLHLNDNASTPEGKTFGYFRLKSDNYPGLTPPDGKFYTKEDWARLEEAATRYGVTIIPEFDTPGHSMAFNQDNPNLPWLGGVYGAFDISSDEKLQVVADYVGEVINEFRPWFKSGIFHLGGDESDNSHAQTTKYLNLLYDKIAKSDANPDGFDSIRVWSFEGSGKYAGINPNIVLESWHYDAMTDKDVKWVDLVTSYYYFVPALCRCGFTREGLDPAEAGRQFQKAIDQYVATGILPDGLFVANWNDISAAKGLSSDFINAGMSKTFPVMGLISWRGQVLGPDGKVIPVETAGLENLIPISQELSSYWVRDRFPYFNGQQAMDVLMDTSRHRYISISADPGADHLVDGSGQKDWMGWDVEDMRKAMNGPTVLRGIFIADLAGEGAAMTTHPGSVCRDVGFALGERSTSSCDADVWSNDITDEEDADRAKIQAWNDKKIALGIENATSADEILSGATDATLRAMPAARQLINAVFAAATNTNADYLNPSDQLKAALAAVDADPVAKEIYRRFLESSFENRLWQYFMEGAAKYADFLASTSDGKLAENIAVERVGPVIAEYKATQPFIDALSTKTYTPGGLLKAGPGTLTLTGNNTYGGGTTIENGVLSVASDANLGAAAGGLTLTGGALLTTASFDTARAVTLTQAGRFAVATGTTLDLTGVVSGSGDLIKLGGGTLRLDNGANAFGNTLVAAGTLIGNASSISGSIGNAATLIFDQTTDAGFDGDIGALHGTRGAMIKRGSGALTLKGVSSLDWSVEAGGLVSSAERFGGNADLHAGTSLTFNQASAATYAGVLSGDGRFSKTGAGLLNLTGDSSTFTGTSTVGNGTLAVNGSLGGSMKVLPAGRLQGVGTVGRLVAETGSIVSPGNSIGTLTVMGAYEQQSGATYVAELGANATSDLIHVGGMATLAKGARLELVNLGARFAPGQRYHILSADGGLDGAFDFPRALRLSAFMTLTDHYDDNNAYLDVVQVRDFAAAGETSNQIAVAASVDSLSVGNDVLGALASLGDDSQARAAYNLLSGEAHASVKTVLVEDSHFVRDAMAARLRASFDTAASSALPVMAYGEDGSANGEAVAVAADHAGAVFWSQAFGSWGERDGDGNAAGFNRRTGGVLAGVDGAVGDWRLGLLTGYSGTKFDVDDRSSSGSTNNYHLGVYGGRQWASLGVRTGAAYSWHTIKTARSVAFQGFGEGLAGDYDAGTFQAFGELGYEIKAGAARFEPFANLAYVNLDAGGFTERGAASALTGAGGSTDATFTTAGLRASAAFQVGSVDARARTMLGWRHGFGDVAPTSKQAFAGGDAFSVSGVPIADHAAVVEAGFDFNLSPAATLAVSYSGQFARDTADHGFNAGLKIRF